MIAFLSFIVRHIVVIRVLVLRSIDPGRFTFVLIDEDRRPPDRCFDNALRPMNQPVTDQSSENEEARDDRDEINVIGFVLHGLTLIGKNIDVGNGHLETLSQFTILL